MTDCKAAEHMPIEDGSRCDCGYFIHQEQGKEEPLDDGESVSPEVTDHGIKEAGDEIKALIAAERQRWETAARLDEVWELLDYVTRTSYDTSTGQKMDKYLNDRIAALTTVADSGQSDTAGRQ